MVPVGVSDRDVEWEHDGHRHGSARVSRRGWRMSRGDSAWEGVLCVSTYHESFGYTERMTRRVSEGTCIYTPYI